MKRPINPQYPVTEVTSLQQLMDMAATMEQKAAERFDELATQLERLDNSETASLFRSLAEEERDHQEEIARWSQRVDSYLPVSAGIPWRLPETFELAETQTSNYTLTPYRALSLAVRNEENAFAFYSYLAAIAGDDAVRLRAEALAKGELEHVARLRMYRRRAYHAERGTGAIPPRRADSTETLRRIAYGLDRGSAALYARLLDMLDSGDGADLPVLIRRLAQAASSIGLPPTPNETAAPPSASQVVETARASGLLEAGTLTPLGILRLALKDAEEVVQIFMDIAEHARDQEVMELAQQLATTAVGRLAIINHLLNSTSMK